MTDKDLMHIIEKAARAGQTSLDLRHKDLTSLPPQIGKLTKLQHLNLSHNRLTSLPPEIGQLTKLERLHLRHNDIAALPHEIGLLVSLVQLDLRDNRLRWLPPEMDRLTNLKWLYLDGNMLQTPPEILEQVGNPAGLISYYLQHQAAEEKEKYPLSEAKLLLVGEGEVGKTSLVRRLVEDEFDPRETATEGISIRHWPVKLNDSVISVNIWDFGGQEIYHATHQFFLTKRSLYLLVIDARRGEQESRIDYWLRIIQSFGGDSPIIVVINKFDEFPLQVNCKAIRSKYPAVKAFVNTSCKTGHGIEELQWRIAQEIGSLEHVRDLWLRTWFNVKTRLENLKQDYIGYNDYQRICREEKVVEPDEQRILLRYLHDLGVVLHYGGDDPRLRKVEIPETGFVDESDPSLVLQHFDVDPLLVRDPRLVETNVLDPEWVTDGVYKILTSPELFHTQGVLRPTQLLGILDRQIYPPAKYGFILGMMCEFELCFEFRDGGSPRFLIPSLLSKEEPDINWPADDECLRFEYHYNVLPGSIVSRFIVQMHNYISRHTYWRTGVVLVRDVNKALVKADLDERKVIISIIGPKNTRREFLAIIRDRFNSIHDAIPKLAVDERIPVPDHPDVAVDYQFLLELESKGYSSFPHPGCDGELGVREMLNGIQLHEHYRGAGSHKKQVGVLAGSSRNEQQGLHRRGLITRLLVGIAFAIVGIGCTFLLPLVLSWQWLLTHNHRLGIQLGTALGIFGIAWAIADPDEGRRQLALMSVVLAASIAIVQIV